MEDRPDIKQLHIVPTAVGRVRFSDYAADVFTDIPSRKGIKKAIKKGAFLLDGSIAHSGDWIQAGQRIVWLDLPEPVAKVFPIEYPVHYEDDHLAVVYKPAGLVVNGNQYQTLENSLPHNLASSTAHDALASPRTTHRLDKSTSGLVLVAKTARARVKIGQLFETRQIQKTYRAVVQGSCPTSGKCEQAIDGLAALTSYRKIKEVPSLRDGHISLVEVYPHTGRTHQIRRHLAQIGFPIVGDTLYGQEGNVLRGKGLFLAATGLQFVHPIHHQELSIQVGMPPKFSSLLDREERRAKRNQGVTPRL